LKSVKRKKIKRCDSHYSGFVFTPVTATVECSIDS
jgi:hypothetical protein